MKKFTVKVCVASFPWASKAPYKFLPNLLKILEPLSDSIVLIDGNTDRIEVNSEKVKIVDIGTCMHYAKDIRPKFYSMMLWLTKCILAQVRTSLELIKVRKEVNIIIFYMAYPYYILPLITTKFLRKKAIEVIIRSKPNSLLPKILSLQDPILFRLLDGISPESKVLIRELSLAKYKKKLLAVGSRFIDTFLYNIKKELSERENIVGYIGRIREEKGVKEFVKAIPLTGMENNEIEFLIGGSGDLLDWVKNERVKFESENRVKITITGFIKEEDFPNYLNVVKLLVLPTQHAEGLPTIILEAMACGTPVLTTSVGAIPDVIKDGETGFILRNNSPECIAENILRILEYPNLNEIVKNARKLIEQEFTCEAAVERYRRILKETLN